MASKHFLIKNAQIDERYGLFNVSVENDKILAIKPVATTENYTKGFSFGDGEINAAGGFIAPPFAEPHTHPDKVYSRERIPSLNKPAPKNRPEMMQRQRDLKAQFTAADVQERATRFIENCVREGIGTMAGQADIDSITGLRSVEGVLASREANRDILDLIVTAFPQEGIVGDKKAADFVREAMRMGADRVGGWPNNELDHDSSITHLKTVFEIAEEFGAAIDINIDYFTDPTERLLEPLAEMTIAHGMQGKVNANHVGALETYSDEDAKRVIEKVAAAGITITVCTTNLAGTAPYRGVSRPNELIDAGVPVAIGIGNFEDNWEYMGTLNPLERSRFAWHALALGERLGEGINDTWNLLTKNARRALSIEEPKIEVGAPANFVIIDAADRIQALRNEPSDLAHFRHGELVSYRSVESING